MSLSNKSLTKESSQKETDVYSERRYFINNLDSYHGEYILKEVSKAIQQMQKETKEEPVVIVAEDAVPPTPPPPPLPYEIIGTVIDPNIKQPENVTRIVPRNEAIAKMITCGTVILDISYDRDELKLAMDYLAVLRPLLETLKQKTTEDDDDATAGDSPRPAITKRYLILISTVMTWTGTKPLDPDNPDFPFVETDFRKRKPHPNYRMHYDAESEVVLIARKYKALIGATVVTTGVTYGGKEDVLFYWFQKAWECEPILPILGRGTNAVPLMNVRDLAQVIYHLIKDFPKKLYILAVEQTVSKQKQIIKSIGRNVGTGMFKYIPSDDAFLIPELDQRIFDLMTANIYLEPTFIVETMGLQWASEAPFPENVPVLIKQFKRERGLKSFKVVIYGPPLVGKTTLAKKIAVEYGLVYISPDTAANDVMEDLKWRINHWSKGEMAELSPIVDPEEEIPFDDDDEDPSEEEARQEAAKQTLALLESGRVFTDEEIYGFIRQRMLSRAAMNRGWVLDGFPTTMQECEGLFQKGEEQDDEVEIEEPHEPFDEDTDLYNTVLKKILPDIVVSLEATDDFICEKAMKQSDPDPRFDEKVVYRNLAKFLSNDHRDITPLNFFDELDIHPLVVHVTDHADYEMKQAYADVSLRMGRPCRYGKLLAIIEAAEKQKQKEMDEMKRKQFNALKELERKLAQEREEKMEYWTELHSILREEEESALAVASEPMRNYLVQHIFPTLTPALLEVAKVRPDDPVDFLGQGLFKNNPITRKFDVPAALLKRKVSELPGDLTKPESTIYDVDLNHLTYDQLQERIAHPLGKTVEGALMKTTRTDSVACVND